MNITILEQSNFWTHYFLNLICTIVILFAAIFFFMTRKENRLDKYIFIGSLSLVIVFSSLLVVPKTLDIKQLITKEYEIQEGILSSIKMYKKGESYDTIIFVNDESFKLNGKHNVFRDFLGYNLQVNYLKNSKYVMKIDLLEKE